MPAPQKALVHRWIEEVFNQGKMTAADELAAADYVHHDPVGLDVQGLQAFKQLVTNIRTAFSDFRISADDLIEEGDKVALRFTLRGTHKGEFLGVGASNVPLEVTGAATLRFAQGRIAETWNHWDALSWMRRVGASAAALIHRCVEEVFNQKRYDVVDEIFAENAVFSATLIPEVRGCAAIKKLVPTIHVAFPDIRYSLVGEPLVNGDRCAYRWTATGTHRGEFVGIAPTGKVVTHGGTGTYRVRDGKIVELLADWDALDLMRQMGAAPEVGRLTVAAH